jgi:hypothetical protein
VAFDDTAAVVAPVVFEHSVDLGNTGLLDDSLHGVVVERRRWALVKHGVAVNDALLRKVDSVFKHGIDVVQ